MSNATFLQIPANIDEPLVLRRVLLQMVSRLDKLILKTEQNATDLQESLPDYVPSKKLIIDLQNRISALESKVATLEGA